MTRYPLPAPRRINGDHHPAPGTGTAHGTFGELLQGALYENDLEFLVTFPITLAAVAEFWPDPASRRVVTRPGTKRKSRLVAERVLRYLGCDFGGTLVLTSVLPEGKGLASSSADLVATARALGDAFGRSFTGAEIESFIRGIEPSDGVMYPGIAAFYHREVRLREHLGHLPPFAIVAHDVGGTVDTVEFHKAGRAYSAEDKQEYSYLLDRLRDAIQGRDLETVGEVATRSAEMNLRFLPRDDFRHLLGVCREVEGLGLVQAHSGTNLGVLLPGAGSDFADRVAHITEACRHLPGSVHQYLSLGRADRDNDMRTADPAAA
jgi:uncharacterized protein involved in propanediol utilization